MRRDVAVIVSCCRPTPPTSRVPSTKTARPSPSCLPRRSPPEVRLPYTFVLQMSSGSVCRSFSLQHFKYAPQADTFRLSALPASAPFAAAACLWDEMVTDGGPIAFLNPGMKLEATRSKKGGRISVSGFPPDPATKVLPPDSPQREALFEGLGLEDPGENECYVSLTPGGCLVVELDREAFVGLSRTWEEQKDRGEDGGEGEGRGSEGGWPSSLADDIDGVQRVVLTCEGGGGGEGESEGEGVGEGEGEGEGEGGELDFLSMTLPCAYDSFFSCLR